MKKRLILSLALFVGLVSCQENEYVTEQEVVDGGITFTVEGSSTKVSGSNFDDADIISVFAYEADGSLFDKANYVYDSADNIFKPSGAALGYADLSQELTFIASYPASSTSSYTFTVAEAQNSGTNYEMSDLLVAKTTAVGDVQPSLAFQHKLSSVVLNISGADFSDATITAKSNVSCDIVADSYSSNGSSVAITAALNGAVGVKAIVAPQTLTSGAIFASVVIDEQEYSATMSSSFEMVGGSQYVFEWDLSTGKVAFDGTTVATSSAYSTTPDEDVNTKYTTLAVLPSERTDKDGDYYYAYHSSDGKFNFAACYSDNYTCPVWVAAPMHSWYVGSTSRTDAYASDPDIPCYQVETLGSPYNRGHLLASGDRTRSTATNTQAFYLSNIAPQYITGFNTGGGVWNNFEEYIQDQYESRNDTLYVVNGSYWANTNNVVDGTTVPTHYYKACLRLKQAGSTQAVLTASRDELECVAFLIPHNTSQAGVEPKESYMVTIDELEELTGENFFANVKNAPEDTYTASDWDL